MTKICLFDPDKQTLLLVIDDPRSQRELVRHINKGKLIVGKEALQLSDQPQWAIAHPTLDVVIVLLKPPPVRLFPRHYDVLYCLAEGMSVKAITRKLGIQKRTVYEHIKGLKDRLQASNRSHALVVAMRMGLLPDHWVEKLDFLPPRLESPQEGEEEESNP